jgi:hypothetical protein
MAILSFQINGTSYVDMPTAACELVYDNTLRYFDDTINGIPVLGSTIYIDDTASIKDTFLEDGITPKVAGNEYWYKTNLGYIIKVNENAEVIDLATCPEEVSPGPNFSTEKNYKLDNVAKPLLRTNPKLTTNIKIITDSADKIYLESINASADLASIEYKRNEVSGSGFYSYDIAHFFNSKKTPYDIVYRTKRSESDLSVLDNYQSQLEEDYQYGATLNYSKLYEEKLRIFAPIWADLNMPKIFVIFKVAKPATAVNFDNTAVGNFDRIQSMLANAEIVKTFDLTNKSSIGRYIRNHVQDEKFPVSPLTFSFEENEKSSYNGIDLVKGGFTSKPEYLYKDLIKTDKPLIEANDFITDGFKRNSMVSANILNLEFLFDDLTAADYSVNRYFGLYVDDIDSGLGEISTSNYGKLKFNSVKSYVKPEIGYSGIPSNKLIQSTPTLGYASIADKFFKIDSNLHYDETNLSLNVVDANDDITKNLGIKYTNKSINIEEYLEQGFDFVKFKVKATPIVNDNIAIVGTKEEAYSFKFIKHNPNENITVTDDHGHSFIFNTGIDPTSAFVNFKTGFDSSLIATHMNFSQKDNVVYLTETLAGLGDLDLTISGGPGNIIKVTKIYTNVNLNNNTIYAAAPGALQRGRFEGNKFSQDGKLTDIAIAISAAINNLKNFTSFNSGEYVYIKSNIAGYRTMQNTLLVNLNNNVDFIDVENLDVDNLLGLGTPIIGDPDATPSPILPLWKAHYFNGGHNNNQSVLINSNTISEVNVGDYIPTKYDNEYNKVIDIVEHIDALESGFHKVILKNKNSISSGEARLFRENNLRLGLFSVYDVYDLNFDFYDTANSDLRGLNKELEANINYEPYAAIKTLSDNSAYAGLQPEEILDEAYDLAPIDYFSNLLPVLEDETVDGIASGFIASEFDRLQENNTKEFALNSRVVPNINKWVLKNTFTTREQPYYLNANEAFGRTNFAPDLGVEGRDRKSFTHEWFYMDRPPSYIRPSNVSEDFNYINFIKGFTLSKDLFFDTDNDYFDKLMVSEGLEVGLQSTNPNSLDPNSWDISAFLKSEIVKKYTLIEKGNDIGFANTFFKGIKVVFKPRKEFTADKATEFVKNTEFNGYKFSTIVKVNKTSDATGVNKVEYDVIQNKAHKFVVFFITLTINDYFIDSELSIKQLYELNHKMKYDGTASDDNKWSYDDIVITGALDLLNTDFTGTAPFIVPGIADSNGALPNFDNQIATGANGLYGTLKLDFGTGTVYVATIQSVNSNSELLIQGIPHEEGDPSNLLPTSLLTSFLQENATYTYEGGGINTHKIILEKISINNIFNLLNTGSSDIKYTTINTDGTQLDNRFVINFEGGKEIIKNANLTVTEDVEKPKSYKLNSGNIGYNIVEGNRYYPFLIRHSGDYTVDMRPVITFTDIYTHFKINQTYTSISEEERDYSEAIYKHSMNRLSEIEIAKAYYNKYNRTGTSFNLGFIKDTGDHDKNWGMIKNHFYHKVNEINTTGVTKLTASSEFLPLYPLISEIAIDKKDINVFRSSWDSNYYTRSLAGGVSVNVPGTFDVIEERSYLASTIMTLENSYNLLSYTSSSVDSKEELDDILRNSNNTTDVVLFEDDNNLIADFYLNEIIYKRLRDSGVLATLNLYVNPINSIGDKTSLVDDSESYIIKNLLDVFTVDNLKLFTKAFKGSRSTIISSTSVDDLNIDGFSADVNFTYNPHVETPLNFRLIYNKRLGYSYDIKPMIKIKS